MNTNAKVIISLIKRTSAASLAAQIAGVQPMTGPVGQIFGLRPSIRQRIKPEFLYNSCPRAGYYSKVDPEDFVGIYDWCNKNFENEFWNTLIVEHGYEVFLQNEKDVTWFLMRWL